MTEQSYNIFCLQLKMSITEEVINFSILVKLHIGSRMVLGYFDFLLGLEMVLVYILPFFLPLFYTELLDARSVATVKFLINYHEMLDLKN